MINCHAEDLMKYLGATVDPTSEPDVEAACPAEIERRLIEIDTGTVELIQGMMFAQNCSASLNGENNGIRI